MPFKTTANWLFNDMWCYLVIAFFDWKIDVFQQTVVRVYCILNNATFVKLCATKLSRFQWPIKNVWEKYFLGSRFFLYHHYDASISEITKYDISNCMTRITKSNLPAIFCWYEPCIFYWAIFFRNSIKSGNACRRINNIMVKLNSQDFIFLR